MGVGSRHINRAGLRGTWPVLAIPRHLSAAGGGGVGTMHPRTRAVFGCVLGAE
jgi:hypothetical protein